jgi:hypothetical protein
MRKGLRTPRIHAYQEWFVSLFPSENKREKNLFRRWADLDSTVVYGRKPVKADLGAE